MTNADVCIVFHFVSVFDPFTMGTMLLFKITIPFVLVTTTFGLIVVRYHTENEKKKFYDSYFLLLHSRAALLVLC